MDNLPAPLLSIASHQLSGRGRGGNVWLSSSGCLQFSVLLRVASQPSGSGVPYLPAPKLVFVQYLFSLAVVHACHDIMSPMGKRVRLKWPNDIYAVVEEKGHVHKKKLGGVLVSTSFKNNEAAILIGNCSRRYSIICSPALGCGLNVFNDLPTSSLSAINTGSKRDLKVEDVAASICGCFEKLWGKFSANYGSFQPFMDDYLDNWLHSCAS